MNWVLDHLQLIFVIGGAIAWWLNQRRQAQAGGDVAPPEEEATFQDPELADRTRRIREEIQRKIEQRARGHTEAPPPMVTHDPVAPPPMVRDVVVTPPPAPVARHRAPSHLEAQRLAEILEHQAAIAAQLQQAREMKAAAARRTEFEASVSSPQMVPTLALGAMVDDLRNPDALRRAFLVREVLGPPVALRR